MLLYGNLLRVEERVERMENSIGEILSLVQGMTSSQKGTWQIPQAVRVRLLFIPYYSIRQLMLGFIRNMLQGQQEPY